MTKEQILKVLNDKSTYILDFKDITHNAIEFEDFNDVADAILILFGVSITEGQSCKCGNKTFTHRHTNWIECTSCNRIKVLQD